MADFQHQHASHCESGVMSAIVRHYGLPFSEPMAFGLASALSFAWLPFVKLGGLPLVAYRMPPKAIIRGLKKPLALDMRFETFRDPARGMARLDALLAEGKVVGLQTSVFWLPYMPEDLRFHFNAHNVLVYGRDTASGDYLLSDPVFEHPVCCAAADLSRARFARGVLAPKGLLYYPTNQPSAPDWGKAIPAAIRKTERIMLKAPVPLIGARGIERAARAVGRLPSAGDVRHSKLFIGHLVRMQEEIGTGGAGFRYLYASFLEEAASLANRPTLKEFSGRLVDIGDRWREFALAAARMIRDRDPLDTARLATMLSERAAEERAFFTDLGRAIR